MNSFYIFSYTINEKTEENEDRAVSVAVIFCSNEKFEESDLQTAITEFYEQHYQPDRIFILGSNKMNETLLDIFVNKIDSTFKGIPRKQETSLSESIRILSFNKDAKLNLIHGKTDTSTFEQTFLNEGLQQIFITRGGLIVAESAHHYVFPSKKHCDKFLRTGNVLLYSSEITFIAFALLKHFDETKFNKIFSDTSSINSVAYALFELKNRFLDVKMDVLVESFSSYDGLYKNPQKYTKDSLLLISASTSANILKYILSLDSPIERDNIVVLFYLAGQVTDIHHVRDQVLCDLTRSKANSNGIEPYVTYKEGNCELCKKGSYAVPVSGDVFLLETPNVNSILITKTDRDSALSNFVNQFRTTNNAATILKAHYKEHGDEKYEVYIDFQRILADLESRDKLELFKIKLDQYIDQYIPGNTKYILHLPDAGSKDLATYIYNRIKPSLNPESLPLILNRDEITTLDKNKVGAIVVIGSCISNGKNLLYISRALREYESLQIVYFIGLLRTCDRKYADILSNNLTLGKYGGETYGFHAVSTMFCNNNSKKSPWKDESEFLKDMILLLNLKSRFKQCLPFFLARKAHLDQASSDSIKGLSTGLFYDRITTTPHAEELKIRKGFAFWDFNNYYGLVTQSDVFFTISNILNSLRYSKDTARQLRQEIYVRNLISPANFNRFNDGIIQASILRAANADELSYDITPALSQEMYDILETIIKYHTQQQGEALLEFLYAIAIKKLRLANTHVILLLKAIEENCTLDLFKCFSYYINHKLIEEPEELRAKSLTEF